MPSQEIAKKAANDIYRAVKWEGDAVALPMIETAAIIQRAIEEWDRSQWKDASKELPPDSRLVSILLCGSDRALQSRQMFVATRELLERWAVRSYPLASSTLTAEDSELVYGEQ